MFKRLLFVLTASVSIASAAQNPFGANPQMDLNQLNQMKAMFANMGGDQAAFDGFLNQNLLKNQGLFNQNLVFNEASAEQNQTLLIQKKDKLEDLKIDLEFADRRKKGAIQQKIEKVKSEISDLKNQKFNLILAEGKRYIADIDAEKKDIETKVEDLKKASIEVMNTPAGPIRNDLITKIRNNEGFKKLFGEEALLVHLCRIDENLRAANIANHNVALINNGLNIFDDYTNAAFAANNKTALFRRISANILASENGVNDQVKEELKVAGFEGKNVEDVTAEISNLEAQLNQTLSGNQSFNKRSLKLQGEIKNLEKILKRRMSPARKRALIAKKKRLEAMLKKTKNKSIKLTQPKVKEIMKKISKNKTLLAKITNIKKEISLLESFKNSIR